LEQTVLTEQLARRQAEKWAGEMQLGPLVREKIDETGAVA